MKVCIEQVEGGYSVYQEGGNDSQDARMELARGVPGNGQAPAAAGNGMAALPNDAGQTVATVDEALQLAGSMLGGGESSQPGAEASAEQDAQALFESGFGQARMPR